MTPKFTQIAIAQYQEDDAEGKMNYFVHALGEDGKVYRYSTYMGMWISVDNGQD